MDASGRSPTVARATAVFNAKRLSLLIPFWILAALSAYICVLAAEYYLRLRSVQRHHLETAWMWFLPISVAVSWFAEASHHDEDDRTPLTPATVLVLAPIAIASAIALYYPALRLGFLSDDFVLYDLAARNQFVTQSWAFLRPLPLVLYKAAGANPAAFHALVIALHGINSALVVYLSGHVGLSRTQALAAGGLFLTFPANLEAVAWCAGVQDVVMTTGVLGSIAAAALSAAVLSLVALAAALLSKETAVVAPALMWLSNRTRWRPAAAALGVDGIYIAWRVLTRPLADGYAVAPSSYKLKELIVRPYGVLAVPFHGAQIGEWPWLGILLVAGLALLVARAAWLWRGRRTRILLAVSLGLWVLVSVAPVYSMFDVSGTLQGSRYVYLAGAGWSMLLATLLVPNRSRAGIALVIAVCIVGAIGVRLNLVPWIHAAGMRDELLAAVARAKAERCTTIWIRNVPDSARGAYVFRNGLAEAIAPIVVAPSAPEACRISVLFNAP